MIERRQHVRFVMRILLSYKIVGTEKLGKSLTDDLSGGGVRFVAEHPLEPGTRIQATMRLPGRVEPVRFLGEVVWAKSLTSSTGSLSDSGAEVGVKFLQVDPKDREFLMQYAALYTPPSEP